MKTKKTILIALLLWMTCLLWPVQAAPLGTAFTYQGRLMDAGSPADGSYDLQFTLYDDPNVISANQVGPTLTGEDIGISDGYLTVELDFGQSIYGADARWLQAAVRPGASTDPDDFVALSPLQKMTAAPYAVSASEVTGRVRTAGIYEGLYNDYNTWTPKESNREWNSVAMSADGTKQTAVVDGGQIYVSTDSGNTWTPTEANRYWNSVAMSADGMIQTAVAWNGQIYVSTDSGNTWTPTEANRSWISVAMSADGTKQTAVVNDGRIYVSTDWGNTWTPTEANRRWCSVAMSADGTKQTAVVWGGQIYVSTDTGNTWTPKESNRYWRSVAMSADGTKQTAVEYEGRIYVSTDWGNTWTPTEANRYWYSVAMSADGTKQTAVATSGQIYVSTDWGNTWTPTEANRYWSWVAMSADGMIQTAVVWSGQIYVSTPDTLVGISTTSPRQKLDVAGNAAFSGNVGIGTTSPAAPLDVNGDAKVGGKQVAVGEEKLRIIRGTVLANGSIHAGSGFTVTKGATGFYQINFSTAFSARPSVVGTFKYPDYGDDFGSFGTSSNVYTICAIAVDTVKCKIKVQGTSGGAVDRSFEFIAVGPR